MELVNRIDDLMAVLFETDTDLRQAGDELRLLNDLRNENTALEERIERLEGKLDDAYQDIADLKDRLKEAEDALEDARTM
jgi:predicted  nucleic acid-binding Zn-ribbon protein